MEEESPDVSPTHSFISYALPDDMIRPISASESAVLSKYISPPLSQGLPQSTYSFGALPPLKELPSSPVSPRIPKTPVRTLKQKVSRLFSSSDKRASPRLDIDVDTSYNSRNEKDVPRSPLSNDWDTEDSVKIRHSEMVVDTTSSEYERLDPSHHGSEDPISHRRPNWGPHSSNRHQTLQDALRQLETDNNGLAFEDIVRYLDAENGNMVETGDGNADYGVLDGKVERPWQPDTWNEPTVVRMPHNRPSDSNLSTNAPSTRASIRPYVERAAAFMAGGGGGSSSSSLASDPAERREASKVETINENNYEKDEVEENYEDEEEDRADDRSEVSAPFQEGYMIAPSFYSPFPYAYTPSNISSHYPLYVAASPAALALSLPTLQTLTRLSSSNRHLPLHRWPPMPTVVPRSQLVIRIIALFGSRRALASILELVRRHLQIWQRHKRQGQQLRLLLLHRRRSLKSTVSLITLLWCEIVC